MSTYVIIDQTDPVSGYRVQGALTFSPPTNLRLGVDFPPTMTAAHRQLFPDYRYRRLFADGNWSELPALLTQEPAEVLAHVSAKQHTEASLDGLLDGLNRDIWLTYYHEPMGNVQPAAYRATAAAVAAQIEAHPNGHRVLHNGPNLTRYWMDDAEGDPDDWWYDGATIFTNDCYTGGKQYRAPANMFASTIAFAAAKGVPWAVPELGGQRIAADVNGVTRASWLRDLVEYAAENECLAMAWFCKGDTGHLEKFPNELAEWQGLLTEYA